MRLTFRSKVAQSPKYRPDIDGLRAIAVLPVVFYHAGVAGFPGGYVGVDVFFVISGYLIASIIAKDIELKKFSFVTFYERRMRRIFPALFVVAFFCVVAATILLEPKDFTGFGKSLMAMTAFISNIYFRREAGNGGYFGNSSETQALLHTWSLSVEEQFYIFFPAALILLGRWAKGLKIKCILLAIIASFFASVWGAVYKPEGTFYLAAPRSWELLIGAILAMKPMPPLNSRVLRELAGVGGLGLIAYAVFMFDKQTDFPGLNALYPCLGAWLIIYSGENGASSVRTILGFRPLVFVGVISYSLYLWHWPIIVFSKYFAVGELNDMETAMVVVSSLLMAFISFEFIESPFRGADSVISRQQVFIFGITASLVTASLGLVIYLGQGFPQRYNEKTREFVLTNSDRKSDYEEKCGNFKIEVHNISDIDFCEIGHKESHNIMFWGDSHVQQLLPLFEKMHAEGKLHDKGAIFTVATGCPPTEHMNHAEKHYHCDSFAHLAIIRAEQDDIDTVFIGFSTWWALKDYKLCLAADGRCLKKLSSHEAIQRFLEELASQIHALKMHGKRVIVELPFPLYDKSIPDVEIHNAVFGHLGGRKVMLDQSLLGFRDQIVAVAKSTGADIFDPRESLCDNQKCTYQRDGISIYKDSTHIAASQIGILEKGLLKTLDEPYGRKPE